MIFSIPAETININERPEEEIDKIPAIDYDSVKKAAAILRALNNNLRQQVIKTIHESIRVTVTQLCVRLQLEQSIASQHLAILRKAGIVSTERDGKYIFYSISFSRIAVINGLVKSILK